MESKLRTLSVVILVTGIIGAVILFIGGMLLAGNFNTYATSVLKTITINSNNTFERSYSEKTDLDKAFPEQYEVGKTIIGE